MDKLLGALIVIASAGVAVIAAKFSNRLMQSINKAELEHSKKVAEEMDKAFKKAIFQAVQESVDKTMGFKKSRHGNNARF